LYSGGGNVVSRPASTRVASLLRRIQASRREAGFWYTENMENELHQQVQEIKTRNARVEADKAWETSWVRRGFIAVVTYIFATIWLNLINADSPFLNAFIPTVGYILSTVSLDSIKRKWIQKKMK
jgi:hypothetical protein